MVKPLCPEEEFIEVFQTYGASEAQRRLGYEDIRSVFERRESIERRTGRQLKGPHSTTRVSEGFPNFIDLTVEDGTVLVGSDAHYWPDIISTAHRAFLRACKEMKPAVVVMNGDMVDGATISRHPPMGWEHRPSLIQEIETVKDRLGEVTLAAGKARRIWSLGNHDARYEMRLATLAPEYAKIHGVHLKDHFPDYEACWGASINDRVVIKHRFKNGIHATHNAALWAGRTMVTGHLHSLKVTPFTDYNGTRWGVDTGTMADPFGPQFEYQEENPRNHRSGFAVLTFVQGRLMWPELVHVIGEGQVEFRGKIWTV